jgi:hypothetical protein
MKRQPVESSSIASVGYDPTWKMLEIEFKDTGEVYLYFDVPQSEYEAFMRAPSKGTYLNQQFKKAGYRFERVDKTK